MVDIICQMQIRELMVERAFNIFECVIAVDGIGGSMIAIEPVVPVPEVMRTM